MSHKEGRGRLIEVIYIDRADGARRSYTINQNGRIDQFRRRKAKAAELQAAVGAEVPVPQLGPVAADETIAPILTESELWSSLFLASAPPPIGTFLDIIVARDELASLSS